jgi:hypothetical protein
MPNPSGEVCKLEQVGGEVIPTLVWYWGAGDLVPAADDHPNHVQVMSSPMVADMNNDGIPEVVFNAFSGSGYNGNGILRILNGQTGQQIASSDGNPMTDGGSQVAVGDIDGDTIPEIVTCSANLKLIAYDFDPKTNKLSVKWESTNSRRECGQGGPGIADFNGDGQPEVYVRYNVHDGKTGELIGSESCTSKACVSSGDGNYDGNTQHAPCDYSVAANLDDEADLELVGGTVAWKVDFENKKLIPYYDHRDTYCDGYPAVADIDLNGDPEVFVVQSNKNTVMAFKHDGTVAWGPNAHPVGAGGPPTIANLDDTPQPELTFAGRSGYIVFDYTGEEKWKRTTQDDSSAKTGSSVFDFDGDGTADIVYADELFLRVYDGKTSETKFCKCNTSGTHWEYPVIVDVNNDGHAEIVVSSNNSMIGSCPTSLSKEKGWDECVDQILKSTNAADRAGTHGVRVFSSPNKDWVNTRKIYNQHAYSITNVSDDGTIPKVPKANWKTQGLNNFRLNVQPGATYLPNLVIDEISSPVRCAAKLPVYFNVVNDGWAVAPSGVSINIYYSDKPDQGFTLYESVQTTTQLGAGQVESMSFEFTPPDNTNPPYYFKFSFDENGPTMCRTSDKDKSYTLDCHIIVN